MVFTGADPEYAVEEKIIHDYYYAITNGQT